MLPSVTGYWDAAASRFDTEPDHGPLSRLMLEAGHRVVGTDLWGRSVSDERYAVVALL